MNRLNHFLDSLPQGHLGRTLQGKKRFLTCGVAGFYGALLATFGGGLLAGRSLTVLAGVSLVSGLSFFVYTYVRKCVAGRERLVLLEHTWFALACSALFLLALGEPPLAYLDVVSVGLCVFLACGRAGCTLVGCCYGVPSSVGIVYDGAHACGAFPAYLKGVRLFPTPAVEFLGLVAIGAAGAAALAFAGAGKVFVWFLAAYAVLRFGLEGLRFDPRPQLLGLSAARWMSMAQLLVALWLAGGEWSSRPEIYGLLIATLVGALSWMTYRNPRRRILSSTHIEEVVRSVAGRESTRESVVEPRLSSTSKGVSIGVSSQEPPRDGVVHVSLSSPDGRADLPLLCELSARAFPRIQYAACRVSTGPLLHLCVRWAAPESAPPDPDSAHERSRKLYGAVARRLQAERDGATSTPRAEDEDTVASDPALDEACDADRAGAESQRSGYFNTPYRTGD